MNTPKVNIDILIIRDNKILLGLLSKQWLYEGKQVYGVPGRDLQFKESIGDAVKRNIQEEIHCEVVSYTVISVNANYAFDNHYVGIGVVTEIKGEVELMKKDDWDRWEWFEKNKIPENLFPSAKYVIDCFLYHKVNVSE